MMFAPSRDEARHFFLDTWAKFRQGLPLSALETLTLEIMLKHPEHHSIFDDPDRFIQRDFSVAAAQFNPFLHLGLHLAVAEQLSIDQPPGIRAQFERLGTKHGNEHAAWHAMMDCLGEALWQAQRSNTGLDAFAYLECISRQQ